MRPGRPILRSTASTAAEPHLAHTPRSRVPAAARYPSLPPATDPSQSPNQRRSMSSHVPAPAAAPSPRDDRRRIQSEHVRDIKTVGGGGGGEAAQRPSCLTLGNAANWREAVVPTCAAAAAAASCACGGTTAPVAGSNRTTNTSCLVSSSPPPDTLAVPVNARRDCSQPSHMHAYKCTWDDTKHVR